MATKLRTETTIEGLRRRVADWRRRNLRTAVVPTMGALHAGHLRLVEQGLRRAERVVVTVFVNPRQFSANEDLEHYPRDPQGDAVKLKAAGAHLIYMPEAIQMYPEGFSTSISVGGPASAGLEDRFRPHFFDGVATVVAKLFIQARCDFAMFGEKDYQQLKVVTRLALDLDLPTKVIGVETVREPDGLAMSSRNLYLDSEQRKQAVHLHKALAGAARDIANGMAPDQAASRAGEHLSEHGFNVDYVAARNAETLAGLVTSSEPVRILAAAKLGAVRLIDNLPA